MRRTTTKLEREVVFFIYEKEPRNHYELRGVLREHKIKKFNNVDPYHGRIIKTNLYDEQIRNISTLDKILRGLYSKGFIMMTERGPRITQEGLDHLTRRGERFLPIPTEVGMRDIPLTVLDSYPQQENGPDTKKRLKMTLRKIIPIAHGNAIRAYKRKYDCRGQMEFDY